MNWGTYALIAIGIFVAGLTLGWHERTLREPAMLEAQKTADTKACADAQAITKGTNDELQKDRDAIAARLSALELQPARCVPISGKAQLRAGGRGHAGPHGITSSALRQYAATCEGYRREVISCVQFIDSERQPVTR